MRIELYEHNERAYENALLLLQSDKKAAVIHPTGTGKSFIVFKLCEDNPDKKICWLSPSEYIFDTQLENLKKVTGGYAPQNISFFTYAKLMNMSEADISDIKPDFIILDEFHRCGAEMWGQGVERLLSAYPNTPILGLSATAIRYLDNQRNMADELFDGNIASEISLGEAIVRGILAPPKYVLSAFSCQKDLEKYQRRVKHAKSKAVRDEGEKYLDALKRALDKADGLDEIFNKHMCERTGKYIVFCSDYEHMCHMKELAAEWFYKIDKSPHIYSLYSEEPSSDKEFAAFKADRDDTHLRLLYCIDALDEGVHVDDISGVILLRPTVSPIIYKQQIGRALQTGINQSAVIFDVVMNIENLYSIDTVEEEMQLAVSYYRSRGMEKNIVNEYFRVIDEVKDCLTLFGKLNETLTASWDYMYEEAKKYYEQNGNLDMSTNYVTNGIWLGKWLSEQKKKYKAGKLSAEYVRQLETLNIDWESSIQKKYDEIWDGYFRKVKAYFDMHGDISGIGSSASENDKKLNIWLQKQRRYYKDGKLSGEKTELLKSVGIVWDTYADAWETGFLRAKSYYKTHGNLNIPLSYADENGYALGAWIANQRNNYKYPSGKKKITETQKKRLDGIGMVWNPMEEQWERLYKSAEIYFDEHGNLDVPAGYKTADGYSLKEWLRTQRNNRAKGTLSKERTERLDKIGMDWLSPAARSWETYFSACEKYYMTYGNIEIGAAYADENGLHIGRWLKNQRKNKARLKSDGENGNQIKRLESIGMTWENTDAADVFNVSDGKLIQNNELRGRAV